MLCKVYHAAFLNQEETEEMVRGTSGKSGSREVLRCFAYSFLDWENTGLWISRKKRAWQPLRDSLKGTAVALPASGIKAGLLHPVSNQPHAVQL